MGYGSGLWNSYLFFARNIIPNLTELSIAKYEAIIVLCVLKVIDISRVFTWRRVLVICIVITIKSKLKA